MSQTRRGFLVSGAAAGGILVMPRPTRAAQHEGMGGDTYEMPGGELVVHPIDHASVVLETPAGVIYVDPVGGADLYAEAPQPDLILITHEHGDHYDAPTLEGLMGPETRLITNPAVFGMLPDGLKERAEEIGNGGSTEALGVAIDAIPAHNITEDRLDFHPEGRDNGYVLTFEGDYRVYLSGDTEDIPEMRSLEGIDVAFVCMNLPFTMTAEQAADAVAEFRPGVVYPYHYRGRDGGSQDPEAFAEMVGDASEVKLGDWYEEDPNAG